MQMTLRSERPIEIACEELYYFGGHLILAGKTVEILVKTFLFFGDHIIFRTKQQHFLRLFWTLQNQNFVIVELTPGPRSALGTPALKCRGIEQISFITCLNGFAISHFFKVLSHLDSYWSLSQIRERLWFTFYQ